MRKNAVLQQIDDAISLGASIREGYSPGDEQGTFVTSAMFAVIDRLAVPGSSYAKKAEDIRLTDKNSYPGYVAPQLLGILKSLRRDVELGYLTSITDLLHAETFSDFLSMAQHLLEEGYKDPAAVIAGSVLEQHLRAIAAKNDIPTILDDNRWKRADSLNADLVRVGAYTKLEQKNVTSWLGLRNEAAHGNFAGYEKANVRLMIDGISLFITQHPA